MTHVLVVLQEDVKVEVLPEDRMSGHTTQKDLVHGDGLLEDGKVLSAWRHTAVSDQQLTVSLLVNWLAR